SQVTTSGQAGRLATEPPDRRASESGEKVVTWRVVSGAVDRSENDKYSLHRVVKHIHSVWKVLLPSPAPTKEKSMSFKKLLVFGALALVAAVAGAVVVMHHPGMGHRLHHGAAQSAPDAAGSAARAARTGVAALGKRWDVSVRDATT